MRSRRMLGGVLAVVLTMSVLGASPGAAGTSQSPAKAGDPSARVAEARTVTLITGDRITVHAKGGLVVEPRAGIRFLTYTNQGHRYVIPSDALPLLRADRVDRRLFDLTELLNAGYDKRVSLPLIVTGATPTAKAGMLKVSRQLPAVKGFAASGTRDQLRGYWESLTTTGSGVAAAGGKVWLDGVRHPSLDVSVPQIGAPAAWTAGLDGAGVKVAVLDTGIDPAHPDLAGKIAAEQNFAAEEEDALDRVGHGTHVASTIAGSGAASGGRYKGVAPGATLLDGKVCAAFGCAESWILAGMQWAAESGAQVVNMSLGGQDQPELDPLEQAVNELTAQYGTLFVIAAGNSGFGGSYTLGSPASADAALAVGAVDKTDVLAPFSSRGPRVGDAAVKPEITAPGVSIVAANSKDGFLGEPGQSYTTLSGTSMATPHVAGAAAIVTQQHPQWTAAQRKNLLTGSANPNADNGPYEQGAGRVDVARAITAKVTASPATVSFGLQTWPHDDDPVQVKDIVYENGGTADVTLQLSLSDTAGGTFSLSATSVTVPAGAAATVKLTGDTRVGSATGLFGGRVVATAGGVRIQTPYGVDREEQKYVVDVSQLDREGAPAQSYLTVAINLDSFKDFVVSDPDGSATLRLPGGNYLLFSWIDHLGADGKFLDVTQLFWPSLAITADRAIVLDARQGAAVDITVPDKSVEPLILAFTGTIETARGSTSVGVATTRSSEVFVGHLGPKPVAGVSASAQAILGKVVDNKLDPTLLYSLAWTQQGSFYQGFTKHLAKKDLATIKEDFAKHSTDLGDLARFPQLPGGAWAVGVLLPLPGARTFHVTDGVKWEGEFDEVIVPEGSFPDAVTRVIFEERTYQAGRTVTEHFNRGVFGPTLPKSRWDTDWISRVDDEIVSFPPLFGDGEGNAGFGVFTKGRTALYRNGTLVGAVDQPYNVFSVPGEAAAYRLESTVERGAPARLSTRVETVWTFSSGHVDGVKRLPVTSVGFSPGLSDHNTSRAGAFMVIPASIYQQQGSDARPIRRLTVEVSTDDGVTWKKAAVLSIAGLHLVLLKNPDRAGFVSLRATAEDTAGNTMKQTIIHAYEVVR